MNWNDQQISRNNSAPVACLSYHRESLSLHLGKLEASSEAEDTYDIYISATVLTHMHLHVGLEKSVYRFNEVKSELPI